MKLASEVAIITGAGSGIGRGIALALAQENVRIVVAGRREAKLDETVELIHLQGGKAIAVAADVSIERDVETLVQTTLSKYRQIDILVNNAGIYAGDRIENLDIKDWD